jgi:predicted  nucleic acid-binding Zn-ribbon protein
MALVENNELSVVNVGAMEEGGIVNVVKKLKDLTGEIRVDLDELKITVKDLKGEVEGMKSGNSEEETNGETEGGEDIKNQDHENIPALKSDFQEAESEVDDSEDETDDYDNGTPKTNAHGPEDSESDHDKPEDSESDHDKPEDSEADHDKTEDSEADHDKPEDKNTEAIASLSERISAPTPCSDADKISDDP